MKNLFQYITVLIVLLHAFSCSNDFLKEELTFFGESSPIVISPGWEANDYSIYCQGVGNARFTVADASEWLKIFSTSGQFTNSYATMNCKANAFGAFSEIGMYYTYMTLSVEGKGNLAVPVVHIVEGNPVIETADRLTISFENTPHNRLQFPIQNTGNGLLIWSVVYHPDWVTISTDIWGAVYETETVGIITTNETVTLYLSYNPDAPYFENLSGQIVIASNNKNRPIVEVEIQMDMGYPILNTWESGDINFGRTETTRQFSFSNQGNGFLAWKIDGCPEWLTVSEHNGILHSYNSTKLTFICNRNLISSGVTTSTIYLKTNDKNQPSYPITVIVTN